MNWLGIELGTDCEWNTGLDWKMRCEAHSYWKLNGGFNSELNSELSYLLSDGHAALVEDGVGAIYSLVFVR